MLSLIDELSKKHADNDTQQEVKKIASGGNKLGLLVNERFVNIPAKISDPLFSSLLDEVNRMSKKNSSYQFDYYIMICKLHKPKDGNGN